MASESPDLHTSSALCSKHLKQYNRIFFHPKPATEAEIQAITANL